MYYLTVTLVHCARLPWPISFGPDTATSIAIRDNDIAAEAMGVNIVSTKLLAFFVAGFLAGVAGAFYISALFFVSPEHYEWFYSLLWVGIILIGGVGSLQGVVFGSMFVVVIFKLLEMSVLGASDALMALSVPRSGLDDHKVHFLQGSHVRACDHLFPDL